MKKVKKLLGVLLAAVMVLAMSLPTFADDEQTYSITINNASSGHTYEAYQVFKGDLNANGTTLSNVEWGTGVDGAALLSALQSEEADAVFTDTETQENPFDDCSTAADVAKVLEKYGTDSTEMKAFADIVGKHLTGTTSGQLSSSTSDEKTYTYTISGLTAGYYLVKDKDGSQDNQDDAYTDFILKLVKNTTAEPKADVATSEKKVDDVNDSNHKQDEESWQDSADYDIGDQVPYQLTAKLPDNVSDYTTYSLKFVDTISKGLTYDEGSAAVYVGDNKVEELDPVITEYQGTEEKYKGGMVLTWNFADIKSAPYSAGNEATVTIKYTATLNENAVVGAAGNPNKMHIEFSNNPNGEGTGKTPDDTNIVFTYKVIVNKVDEKEQPLEGAGFQLEKFIADKSGKDTYEGLQGTWTVIDTIPAAEGLTTFTFSGLDDGTYRLTETETPDGYNTIDPIIFTVTAEHDITSDDPRLNSLTGTGNITFTPNKTDGSLSTTVVNKSGAELPETGGMGTRIFYILGAVLVLGAGALLIVRKRTNSDK